MKGTRTGTHDPLLRYLPRRAAEWDLDAPGALWQRVDGALCFVDISGFTVLTEKLAQRGRIGAEELTAVLNNVFGSMLNIAYERGGSLVRFAGDALLLLYEGQDAPLRAASAAIEMRSALRSAAKIPTSVGKIGLRMSVGVHCGPIELYLVGGSHRELVIVGETAARTFELESAAAAGEILISAELAEVLGPDAAGARKDPGVLLRWRAPRSQADGSVARRPVDAPTIGSRVTPSLHDYLREDRSDSEHRIATVGFVKYTGIAAALHLGGPDEVARQLDQLMCVVQEAADNEQVTYLNADSDVDGGKVTLIAGVPANHEDDEGRMLRAARRIVEADLALPISVGISRGHLFTAHIGTEFRSAFTVMGDTINLAARLSAAADVDSILVSPDVVGRSRTLFEGAELEPLTVKGKAEPVPVCFVGPERGPRTTADVGGLPFVGRRDELDVIERSLERAEAGEGSVVSIRGEAGRGKTRLLRQALDTAAPATVMLVRSDPTGVENPYWAFRDPLRELLGIERRSQEQMAQDLSDAVDRTAPKLAWALPLIGDAAHITLSDTPETATIEPQFRRPQIENAIVELLRAVTHGRLVIVVEDHHWMDPASQALVSRLSRATGEAPWVLLVTSRDDPGQHMSRIDTEVTLGPLAEDEARRLVVTATEAAPLRPHDLDAVLARGAGNPFILGEIVRSARETGVVGDLPDSLDGLVRRRIDRLGPATRQIMYHAAVLGRTFRRVVFDELLAGDDLAFDGPATVALSEYLEKDGTTRLRFRDALVLDVAYEGLSYRWRRELHARAASAIERLAGIDRDAVAEPLAMHFWRSGNYEETWRYAVIAGNKARDSYSNVEAAAQYRRALGAARRLGGAADDEVREIWTALADVFEQAGMFDEARSAIQSALRLTDDDAARAELLLRRARTWALSGSLANAKRNVTLGRKGLRDNGSVANQRAAARLDSYEAGTAMNEGHPRDALELAQRAVITAKAAGDEDALARAYVTLDWAYHMLGQAEEATHRDEALEILERLGELRRASDVMNNAGGFAYFAGRWDEAVAWYGRAQDASQRAGNSVDAAQAAANMAEVFIGQGRYDEAAMALEEAHRVLRSADARQYLPFVELQIARMEAETGQLQRAIEELDRLQSFLREAGDQLASLEAAIYLGDSLLMAGEPARAIAVVEAAELRAGQEGRFFAAAIARVRSQALWQLGDTEGAGAVVSKGLSAATEGGLPYDEYLLLTWRIHMASAGRARPDPGDVARHEELRTGFGITSETSIGIHAPANSP